jgi:hypothetical protein
MPPDSSCSQTAETSINIHQTHVGQVCSLLIAGQNLQRELRQTPPFTNNAKLTIYILAKEEKQQRN